MRDGTAYPGSKTCFNPERIPMPAFTYFPMARDIPRKEYDFRLECTVSGVGEDCRGTLADALRQGRLFARIETAHVAIWHDGRKIAEVDNRDFEWVSSSFPQTG